MESGIAVAAYSKDFAELVKFGPIIRNNPDQSNFRTRGIDATLGHLLMKNGREGGGVLTYI